MPRYRQEVSLLLLQVGASRWSVHVLSSLIVTWKGSGLIRQACPLNLPFDIADTHSTTPHHTKRNTPTRSVIATSHAGQFPGPLCGIAQPSLPRSTLSRPRARSHRDSHPTTYLPPDLQRGTRHSPSSKHVLDLCLDDRLPSPSWRGGESSKHCATERRLSSASFQSHDSHEQDRQHVFISDAGLVNDQSSDSSASGHR